MVKKGVSAVVTTVILVLLALVATGIAWIIANNVIDKQVQNINSCFGNNNKVQIEDRLTCYNSSSEEFKFALNIQDIQVEEILVSVSNKDNSESFKLLSEGTTYNHIRTFNGNYQENVKLPKENSGITYFINASGVGVENTSLIKIAPVIDGEQCDVFDSFSEIEDCALF